MLYVYLGTYAIASVALNFWLTRDHSETRWFRLLYVATLPGLWAALPFMLMYGAIH